MSRLRLVKVATPSTPAATKAELFLDTADGRMKMIDELGVIHGVSGDGLRDRNLLINGGFDFAQRQAPGTLTTYSNTSGRSFAPDQWAVTNENLSVQYIRTDTVAALQAGLLARFFGVFSKITNTGKLIVSQCIEGGRAQHVRGRTARLQLKLKASANKTIRVVLLQLTAAGTIDTLPATFISAFGANGTDPTFGTNLSKIAPVALDNTTSANTGLTCAVTTAWQRFGGTFTLPTDFKNLIVAVISDSQFVAADSVSISEAGLYDGPEVRDWSPQSIASDLGDCQRYFCKTFDPDVAPAQNIGLVGSLRGYVSVASTGAGQPIGYRFPVAMRAAPTATFFNPSAANAFARNTTAGSDATATAIANAGLQGADVTFTGIAAWTIAQAMAVHATFEAGL